MSMHACMQSISQRQPSHHTDNPNPLTQNRQPSHHTDNPTLLPKLPAVEELEHVAARLPGPLDARAGGKDEPLLVKRHERRRPLRVGQAADADGLVFVCGGVSW